MIDRPPQPWLLLRGVLSGLAAGAIFGGIAGFVIGTLWFPIIATLLGAIVGAIYGAVLGLFSGIVVGGLASAGRTPTSRAVARYGIAFGTVAFGWPAVVLAYDVRTDGIPGLADTTVPAIVPAAVVAGAVAMWCAWAFIRYVVEVAQHGGRRPKGSDLARIGKQALFPAPASGPAAHAGLALLDGLWLGSLTGLSAGGLVGSMFFPVVGSLIGAYVGLLIGAAAGPIIGCICAVTASRIQSHELVVGACALICAAACGVVAVVVLSAFAEALPLWVWVVGVAVCTGTGAAGGTILGLRLASRRRIGAVPPATLVTRPS